MFVHPTLLKIYSQIILEEVIEATAFKTNKSKYRSDLIVITVCAEEYRYNFDIDCQGYLESLAICDELLKELLEFEKEENIAT